MIKVSDYIIQYLEKLGVAHMFMLPGGGAMHLNDSLGRSQKIQYVVCLHEQACAIAAEAYARVTNKPGLLMVTTGRDKCNYRRGCRLCGIHPHGRALWAGETCRPDPRAGRPPAGDAGAGYHFHCKAGY